MPGKPPRRRLAKPSRARVVAELVVVLGGLFAVVAFVPLSNRWFPWVCGGACVFVGGYAVVGARRPGTAAWWGFTWGGRNVDDLATGVWYTVLLFFASLVPMAVLKCSGVRTPVVPHPVAYLVWCFVQDFLFFSLIQKGIERLTAGHLLEHRHLAVAVTAVLFGLSHYPLVGFMAATALIAVFWGYIFLRTRLLWPVTILHFLLGLLVMS